MIGNWIPVTNYKSPVTLGKKPQTSNPNLRVNKKQLLIDRLSDGNFHSGEVLAGELGVSRTAIWKQIQTLGGYGLDIFCVRGKGYCLSRPLELLRAADIETAIDAEARREIKGIEVFFITDTTNGQLMSRAGLPGFHGSAVVAEFQTAGRGRRGRHWLSPLGAGICLSVAWHFDTQPESMAALSLAAGVAVVRSLHEHGLVEARLKWPNDIICEGKKLGGILLETRGEMAGPCDVVMGIGVNYSLPEQAIRTIDQPVTDVYSSLPRPVTRNALCGTIVGNAVRMFREFSHGGFAAFIDQWRQYDGYAGKQATLYMHDRAYTGTVLGVTQNGLLQMSVREKVYQFANGELSLRMAN